MPKRRSTDKHTDRLLRGETQLVNDMKKKEFENDWNLGWFEPKGIQHNIAESFYKNVFTVVDGPSGCGKTSTALWVALSELRASNYSKLVFAKNPTEVGDDKIGFLSGNEQDKLAAHYDSTKRIFERFISNKKLECDLNKRIILTIPNFLLGATFDNSIVIIDEGQVMSPNTMKLLLERCGLHTKYFILGDSKQRYAVSKRSDGFCDLIERVTVEHPEYPQIKIPRYASMFGYVRLTNADNQRSEGSKLVNKIYGD